MALTGKKQPPLATELVAEASAALSQSGYNGRRLVLKFIGKEKPELDHVEFQSSAASQSCFRHQGNRGDHSFSWSSVPQALALIVLDYLSADKTIGPVSFHKDNGGALAGAFCNAIKNSDPRISDLFAERLPKGGQISRLKQIFGGKNISGAEDGERRVWIESEHLPKECIEIYWTIYGEKSPILNPQILQELARRIRVDLEIPTGDIMPFDLPASLETPKPAPAPAAPRQAAQSQAPPDVQSPVPPPPQIAANLVLPDTLVSSFEKLADAAGKFFESRGASDKKSAPKPSAPKPPPPPPAVALPKIDARLFQIQNPSGYTWEDSEPLLNFGNDDSDADVWRIRDACEGVLIFGGVGSGKTSSSGATIARAFLHAGFGGLVLTVKPDEAARWERMCRETGRECDFIHVTPNSKYKLNFLQYELQRPGERLAITDDLIALFRTLIAVMSRSKQPDTSNDFWTNATNQLMRKLVDIFLLAGEPVSLDGMVRFIDHAPTSPDKDWREDEMFADVLNRAEAFARQGSEMDKRVFRETFDYWTRAYPNVADVTRSGFITAFSAMADNLSGRGIYEMVATETNLTPEMILSGKVVVLDIPLKGNVQGGMMAQSMFKLLFEQAVERRADKGQSTARPAFLWEDEGHMFFSQQDVNFQPTARDVRAPRVILSQNLHNFYQQGHNQHAVEAVFSAMNTMFFHTNGDMTTNRWASDKIGEIRKLKLTTDGLLRPMQDKDYSFWERRPEEVKNVGKMSIAEERKSGLPPEDFARLKRGGDGTSEAVLLWLSHQFAVNGNRNFCVVTFMQEPR